MTCAHCAELEEQVAWLRSELGLQFAATHVRKVADALGIQPGTASLILALYSAKGRTMTAYQVLDALPSPSGNHDRALSNVNVTVFRARKALGTDAILNAYGTGYSLSETGMAKVAAILGDANNSQTTGHHQ